MEARVVGGAKGKRIRKEGGKKTDKNVAAALTWLARAQSDDGTWPTAKGLHDVGLTGLTLLAFLADGHSTIQGEHQATVEKALTWLLKQQNKSSGQFGKKTHHSFLYNHAVATLALGEAYLLSGADELVEPLTKACEFVALGRNTYGAWRYDVPAVGDNDTCISAWCALALAVAQEAGIEIDDAAFDGMETWLLQVTDEASGRVGYDAKGSPSARIPGLNADFPTETGEAMTAIAMTVRSFTMGRKTDPQVWEKQTELLLKRMPLWDSENPMVDMYYVYFGTQAMFQLGGDPWKAWNKSMKTALIKTQHSKGDKAGSWDPIGPWCSYGGRVYSTAMMVLCLEVYYRYPRLLD